MSNERMTLDEEMEQKYPDEWLFIIDCEGSISENTELLSGSSCRT